eukprot:1446834-Pleurochrysis_carterae.AAC.3
MPAHSNSVNYAPMTHPYVVHDMHPWPNFASPACERVASSPLCPEVELPEHRLINVDGPEHGRVAVPRPVVRSRPSTRTRPALHVCRFWKLGLIVSLAVAAGLIFDLFCFCVDAVESRCILQHIGFSVSL